MYAGIRDSLRDTRTLVRKINDKFTQEILSVFGEDYADDLANAMLSVVTLLETMNPKQIKKVMKSAGIRDYDIKKGWDDAHK